MGNVFDISFWFLSIPSEDLQFNSGSVSSLRKPVRNPTFLYQSRPPHNLFIYAYSAFAVSRGGVRDDSALVHITVLRQANGDY